MIIVLSYERLAYISPVFIADRNILQIRLRTTDTSCSGDSLIEMRMNSIVITN